MPFDAEITPKSRDLIVLEKARARLARGWGHGARCLWPFGKNLCIVSSLCHEGMKSNADTARVLSTLGFDSSKETIEWNDAPGRTQAEVLARFDTAIARLSA